MIESDAFEQVKGLVDIRLRELAQKAAPEADIAEASGQHVLHHAETLDQRVLLEDHAHASARAAQFRGSEVRQLDITEENLAAGRFDEPIDAANQRALAGTGRTDQRHDLALGYFQVDVGEREVSRLVTFFQVFDAQH